MSDWQLPEKFIQEYLEACTEAANDDEAFAKFRQNDRINTIIENTPKWWADKAMEKMGCTPTMVRYMYTWHLIKVLIPEWYGSFSRPEYGSIVEIGGGYGGMAKVVLSEVNCQYKIFDLPEVIALQSRFLYGQGYNCLFGTSGDFYDERASLCISWCAWSELSKELREEYAQEVIGKCSRFFICSNYNKEEDLEILSKYFTDIKEYSDDLVQNVLYV